jgi:hypothetical protein
LRFDFYRRLLLVQFPRLPVLQPDGEALPSRPSHGDAKRDLPLRNPLEEAILDHPESENIG